MMLTGGNTAKCLYHQWAVTHPWDNGDDKYFFGNERCVPSDHEGSNYSMVTTISSPKVFQKVVLLKKWRVMYPIEKQQQGDMSKCFRSLLMFYFC